MVVSVVVGLRKISVYNSEVFLNINRSRKLIRLLDSSVGFSSRLECMELA